MKRIVVILLVFVYTAVNAGVVLHGHFCAGKLTDISFSSTSFDKCGKCGLKHKNCCEDAYQYLSLGEEHTRTASQISDNCSPYPLSAATFSYVLQVCPELGRVALLREYELDPPKVPIYIQIRVLRI